MSLIPWKTASLIPVKYSKNDNSMIDFKKEMNNIMSDFFNISPFESSLMLDNSFYSFIDVKENEDKYLLDADMPGVVEGDIDLGFHDNILTIKGERKNDSSIKDFEFVCSERGGGIFRREVSFDNLIDQDKIMASLKNGVLHVELVKKEKNMENRRKIQIKN